VNLIRITVQAIRSGEHLHTKEISIELDKPESVEPTADEILKAVHGIKVKSENV
jgi:hypothetical protein